MTRFREAASDLRLLSGKSQSAFSKLLVRGAALDKSEVNALHHLIDQMGSRGVPVPRSLRTVVGSSES